MTDPVDAPIGHGDQAPRPAPDQRSGEDLQLKKAIHDDLESGSSTASTTSSTSSSTTSSSTSSSDDEIDGPIVGQKPDVSDAPESPSEADTKATGRDI